MTTKLMATAVAVCLVSVLLAAFLPYRLLWVPAIGAVLEAALAMSMPVVAWRTRRALRRRYE